ncbi:MAG TPA: OmpA family protein [Kofleriaceae bacterium]|nr:OmpA family protein [Kofleriaceae bacterium]
MSKTQRSGATAMTVAAFALLLASLLAGCPDKKPKAGSCKTTKDCKSPQVCVENRCVQCGKDSDCKDGQQCKDFTCVAKAECTRDDQCPVGKSCLDGVCKACTKDAECGEGGACDAGACKRATACTKDDDCADDEDCVDGYCRKPWAGSSAGATCELETVYFGYDEAAIGASERDRLDANAACIEKSKGKAVYVAGYTDGSGTEEYNIALSERRAQSVADYLARLGVDPAVLQVVPKGETEPSGKGDDKDRRVELLWK